MGRGDIGTRKGKIFAKSFGNRRPHNRYRKNRRPGAPVPQTGSTKRVSPPHA